MVGGSFEGLEGVAEMRQLMKPEELREGQINLVTSKPLLAPDRSQCLPQLGPSNKLLMNDNKPDNLKTKFLIN